MSDVLGGSGSRVNAVARLDVLGRRLVRVSRGVWLPDGIAEHQPARLAALLAVLPPGSVVSGITAAELYGLWVPRSSHVDITVPAGSQPTALAAIPRRRGVVAHRRHLPEKDVVSLVGVRATSLVRTWCDLAAVLDLPDLVAAGDSALRIGAVRIEELAAEVAVGRRRRGSPIARLAVTMLDDRSRSRPESHVRVALLRAGLPYPQVNMPVYDERGGWLAEPDLSYPEARLAIEYQGAVHADPRQMRKDTARQTDLQRCDWIVLCYTADQIFRHPELLAQDATNALTRRAPHLLTRHPPPARLPAGDQGGCVGQEINFPQ